MKKKTIKILVSVCLVMAGSGVVIYKRKKKRA